MAPFAALLEVLFPAGCASCGRSGGLACATCLTPLLAAPRLVTPTPCPAGFPPTWSVATYSGACRELLLAYKERETVGLAGALAMPLTAGILAAARGRNEVVAVPAPSSRTAIRARGEDVLLLLVRRAAARCRSHGLRVRVVPALRQIRRVADSAGLGAPQRLANLDQALAVAPGLAPRIAGASIVIVDDLVTTGATLVEARRALEAAGGHVVAAATIAATQRRASALDRSM